VAAVALVAILVSRSLLSVAWQPRAATDLEPTPDQPTELAAAAAASGDAQVAPPSAIAAPAVRPALPPCSCERSDSVLWSGGIPQLAVIATTRPGKTNAKKPRIYPEIAVVNNGDKDLKNVILTVDFLLGARDGNPARRQGQEGLLYDGTLVPGAAVKWRTKGKGDDFMVTSSISGKVGDEGLGAAPADAFHKLLSAHTPSVRLHGAKMLAWLGDPRAQGAIEQLEREHREDMTPTLAMLSDAVRSMRVCSLRVTKSDKPGHANVEACVFNASQETRERPAVVVRSADGHEERWIVEASIGAGSGVKTTGAVETGESEAQPLRVVAEP
jgi:hypothetical protein